MKLLQKEENQDSKPEVKETKRAKASIPAVEKKRDSTRWLSLLFLLIFLFLSYLSWAAW